MAIQVPIIKCLGPLTYGSNEIPETNDKLFILLHFIFVPYWYNDNSYPLLPSFF